jgi:hypothetical protein
MEWIGYIILVILLGISIFVNVNLLNKLERREDDEDEAMEYIKQLETWIQNFQQDITKAYNNMKQIDSRGSFEADDEVGTTFKMLKGIIDEINTLTNPEGNDDTK